MIKDRGREFSRLVAVELAIAGKQRGITQKDIADAAGIGAEQMSYYVHGRRGPMTTSTLLAAAEHLGISPRVIADRAYRALVEEMGTPDEPGAAPLSKVAVPSRLPHEPSLQRVEDSTGTTSDHT